VREQLSTHCAQLYAHFVLVHTLIRTHTCIYICAHILHAPAYTQALNRLLDDNHELFIPETQTVVKYVCMYNMYVCMNNMYVCMYACMYVYVGRPHPDFQLFATQNPAAVSEYVCVCVCVYMGIYNNVSVLYVCIISVIVKRCTRVCVCVWVYM